MCRSRFLTFSKVVQRVVHLWNGKITSREAALRLLLIVDYIADWARDVYRKDIVNGLKAMRTDLAPSLLGSTDIPSQASPFDLRGMNNELNQGPTPSELATAQLSIGHLLGFFDDERMAVRDARFVHHNVYGILVTADNVNAILSSVRHEQASQELARKLLNSVLFPDGCIVTAETLNAIENVWTGHDRDLEWDRSPHEGYHARFCVSSCFTVESTKPVSGCHSGHWQQIHDLSFIALAGDAVSELRKRARYQRLRKSSGNHQLVNVTRDDLISILKSGRHASAKRCLAAAVDREVLVSTISTASTRAAAEADSDENGHPTGIFFDHNRKGAKDVLSLTRKLYQDHLVGRKEPSETYLRVSRHHGEQQEVTTDVSHDWPEPLTNIEGDDDAVLVVGVPHSMRLRRTFCLFLHKHRTIQAEPAKPLVLRRALVMRLVKPGSWELNLNHSNSYNHLHSAAHKIISNVLNQWQLLLLSKTDTPDSADAHVRLHSYIDQAVLSYDETDRQKTLQKIEDRLCQIGREYGLTAFLEKLIHTCDVANEGSSTSKSKNEDSHEEAEDTSLNDEDGDDTSTGEESDPDRSLNDKADTDASGAADSDHDDDNDNNADTDDDGSNIHATESSDSADEYDSSQDEDDDDYEDE
jgi:hypothetical protein